MTTSSKTTGLRYWMLRALEECDNVATDFRADPVHDLRVSLRRCRSLADGMMAMDPDRGWKAMKKAAKKLFQSLGALRDVQVMMEWIEKMDAGRSPSLAGRESQPTLEGVPSVESTPVQDPASMLLQILKGREAELKREARAVLEQFDHKQWRQWARTLPTRARRIRPGSAVFKHLALERWTTARELHRRALRNRSQVAFHTLRIGIKRFRYIVENFLPEEHELWRDDLKHMQDLLGEVHDLDVLWGTALTCHIFPDEASRQDWHSRILEERGKRIHEYHARTSGAESLWNAWREKLPHGKQIQELATRRMKFWAKALDPDFAHSERVAKLALELYDGLVASGLFDVRFSAQRHLAAQNGDAANLRESLYAAALLHDVGKSKGNKGHHKESLELINQHGTPLGWKAENLKQAGIVARFHRAALPARGRSELRDLLPDEQRAMICLTAILRLANALDSAHDGRVRRLKVENVPGPEKRRSNGFLRKTPKLARNEALVIAADGYVNGSPTAQAVAAERYLLETVLRRPIIVKAARTGGATSVPRRK